MPSCKCCTPKQIDLTRIFITIQLPYCVSVLLLTSGCKLAPAQYKRHYYLASLQTLSRKQNKAILTLCRPLFVVKVKGLYKLILVYKNEAPHKKWAWHMHNVIVY